jgi:hypothetical protein
MLLFVEHLLSADNVFVIDPGIVRQHLLQYRIILDDGLSLAHSDLLFNKLGCDLILTGKVLDYLDYEGPRGSPKVDFSVELIDRRSRQTVWTSKSYNDGEDGVFFFDLGKAYTAHRMASEMTLTILDLILEK